MERYLLAEDKPAYPCWIILRFRFRGVLQRGPLQEAWRRTVRRHPTLHAVVRGEPASPRAWETLGDEHDPEFFWHADDEGTGAAAPSWSRIDPTVAPAVRLVVVATSGRCEVSLEGHHAVFDGAAAFAVVHELWLHYAQQLGTTVSLPELRAELFPQRGRFGLSAWDRVRLAPVQLLGLWFAWQMQRRTVVALAPHRLAPWNDPPSAGFPTVLHQHLPATELAHLRTAAKQHGASLNDLLIRDLQTAIGVWRMREGIGSEEDWVVVGVPVSLRRPADRLLPAANVIGIVAIDRRARSLANRPRLLRRAREDMALVKRHRLGFTFLVLLAAWRWRRGGIARYSGQPVARATAVLTNLGQPFSRSPLLDASRRIAVPGAVLEDYTMIAPCRPGTCASIAVALYGGQLHVDLHYDPRALNDRQAETFLAAFLEQLYTSAAEAATATS